MIVNLYLKEESSVTTEDSITISVMRRRSDKRIQMVNAIHWDKLSDSDQLLINSAVALLEKYSNQESGATNINYNL